MSIMHDFECKKHGVFEGSHPICPAMGCDSATVQQVYLQAPGILSGRTKHFDKGVRKTSEQMGLLDFNSTQHAGDSSFHSENKGGVLWGNEAAKYFGGVDAMASAASAPLNVPGKPEAPSGMRATGSLLGSSVRPPTSELTRAKGDTPIQGS